MSIEITKEAHEKLRYLAYLRSTSVANIIRRYIMKGLNHEEAVHPLPRFSQITRTPTDGNS